MNERKFRMVERESENYVDGFLDPKFLRTLRRAGAITRRTGHEAGFILYSDGSLSKVQHGTTDETDLSKQGLDGYFSNRGVFAFHFHPNSYIVPSRADISGFSVDEAQGVGIIDDLGNVDILLVKRTFEGDWPTYLIDDFYDEFSENYDYRLCLYPGVSIDNKVREIIKEGFSSSGLFFAEIVSLKVSDKAFSGDEEGRIRKFFGSNRK